MLQKHFYSANIKNFAVHHFGGLGNDRYASTQHLTEKHIENAHKSRWPDFKSQLNGSYIGYNAIIWPDGTLTQYRLVGEETAAVIGHNKDTLSVCLAGNFNRKPDGQLVDTPTEAQIRKLSEVQWWAHEELKISIGAFKPHRGYSMTECYGTGLPDDWARKLFLPFLEGEIVAFPQRVLGMYLRILLAYFKLKDAMIKEKQPAASIYDRGCPGNLQNVE